MVSPPVEDQPPETRLTSEPSRRKWGIAQIGKTRFWILVFCVLCQGATLLITWTLWDVRAGSSVPNLPVFDWLPQLPFGILLIVSLLFVLVDPKRGLFIHLMILAIASLLDQMRLQPQFLANWMLMLACVYPEGLRIVRWFLATLWLWAGLHKLLSPMWFGMQSWTLVERTGLDGQTYYLIFAIFVVVGEIVVGLTARFKPRWAA